MAGLPANPLSGEVAKGAPPKISGEVQKARNSGNCASQIGDGNAWSPSSWKAKPIKQGVGYDDEEAVGKALTKLESLPPLVTAAEVSKLRASLKEVALGKAFLLQGGDCAEIFDYCTEEKISAKVKLLLQMSMVLIWGGNIPVVRIGRMAGQYAKPRSSLTEIVDGKEIPSFRGDIINGSEFSERAPDPTRLVSAYYHSATTLNFLRGQLSSGFADLHHPFEWTLSHVRDSETKERYQAIVNSITDTIRFMHTIGADTSSSLGTVDLYTSHEGLLLEYEQGLTRLLRDPMDGNKAKWYATSAHFIWIGDRTRQLDCAHVEYFRGIENPIGIKVGPTMVGEDLAKLLDIVNPNKEVGKVTLITRYGADKVNELLPGHIDAVVKSGHTVVCNTRSSPTGVKTRQFENIMTELSNTHYIHQRSGTHLGGVHLELTADAVTECVGGSENLTDDDLLLNYTTHCDPRLNNKQALEAAFMIAAWYRERS
ncbi:DAHP synthetase [Tuber magnatum]|uniref:Phospho-2-dehydro-3-deoxyheptonate aldolase n=1 Tax=Tuber magnatum TaxID=42249 RepID=A0A317SD67_9PEZI|nr:DAHP synthetase [Tuber magnatum]